MKACCDQQCRRDLVRHRLLRQRQAGLGMPEESPDFSPEDVFDLLEFYQRKLAREQEERRQVHLQRRRYLRRQRSLERIVRAVLECEAAAGVERACISGRNRRTGVVASLGVADAVGVAPPAAA